MRTFGKIGRWVLEAIGLAGDAQFTATVLWPWFVAKALPVIAVSAVITASVLARVPWYAYPFVIPAAFFVAILLAALLLRLVPAWPFRNEKDDNRTEAVPQQSIGDMEAAIIAGNVNVTTYGQRGGQTAANITNVGSQPRTLGGADLSGALRDLSQYAGTTATVCCLTLDSESNRFADEIDALLRRAKWAMQPVNRTLLGHQFRGVCIRCPEVQMPAYMKQLAKSLEGLGIHVEVATGIDIAKWCEILVLGN